jgi:TonB family protein
MREVLETVLEEGKCTSPDLRLLIAREPWARTFVQNVGELFRRRTVDLLELESAPAAFWPDVFVERELPWVGLLESGVYHLLALVMVIAASRFLAFEPRVAVQPRFTHADLVYYSPSEYLPPLDTRRPAPARAQKADPELAAQPIISVPPEANNRSQTVVTPPKVKLQHDVALPNTVAWSDKPKMPIAPAPVVLASEISRLTPRMEPAVIAPPVIIPAIRLENASRKTLRAPEAAVIAPPPALDAAANRKLGERDIGHSSVIAPAPQLSVDEQRAVPDPRASAVRQHATQVIAPPPSLSASGGSRTGREMVALSLHPAVAAPAEPVAGNRRGSFAATPEGHVGASGAPGSSAGGSTTNEGTPGKNGTGNLPSGLYVGKATNPSSAVAGDPRAATLSANLVNPKLLAGLRPPRTLPPPQAEGYAHLSETERTVFGNRKVYSLSLSMPNLNSAGGSWLIRFAAIKADSSGSNFMGAAASDELSAPAATRKVDPAYPLELMRQNVGGTVILYAVIRADGAVEKVRVLRSVDERIDQFASEAIAKWQFDPATKNGSPVDVEATFWIPFRPVKTGSNF